MHRAPLRGTHDHGDFIGTPFLVEAKATNASRFQAWARAARLKTRAAGTYMHGWIVVWHGDRHVDPEELVLMPWWLFADLVGQQRLDTRQPTTEADHQ